MADDAIALQKRCPKCGADKPATLEFYGKNKKLAYGLRCWCKACEKIDRERRNLADPDRQKRTWAKHKQKYNQRREGQDARKRAGPEGDAIRAYWAEYRKQNKDKIRSWQDASRQPRQAEYNRRQREALRADPERRQRKAEKCEEWRRANRERARTYVRNRRAALKGCGGTHTKADIDKLYKEQNGQCFYCGQGLSDYHVDHFVPVAKGGSNDPANLVIACRRCNQSKADKMPWDFIEQMREDGANGDWRNRYSPTSSQS